MACSQFNFQESSCTNVDVGFDFSKTLTFTDSDGVPVDITGYILAGEIKTSTGGTTVLNLPEVPNDQTTGLYIPDRTVGIIYFQIKLVDTGSVDIIYPYEITITAPSSDFEIFMQGTIQFLDRNF